MSKKIAIIGAGGHGKVVGEIALLNNYDSIDFFDDNYLNIKKYPFEIKGNVDNFAKVHSEYNFWFVAIGNNQIRKEIIFKFSHFDKNLTNLLHPKSVISKFSKLENGICVMANVVINPGVEIKKGSIINSSASIDHDCIINDFVHIAPNATLSGNVSVGQKTLIGTGTSVHPGVRIGDNVKVGVGSKIYKNLENNVKFIN